MARLVVTVTGTGGPPLTPPAPPTTYIDANGNLMFNGTPILLLQASALSYNDWFLGGYTEAQADAMIQIAVNGGMNCQLARMALYPYSTPQYVGQYNAQVIHSKFPQVLWNGDDRDATQTAAGVAAFIQPRTFPFSLCWGFASEPGDLTQLANYQYLLAADPSRQVICLQNIRGVWLGYQHMYGTTVFDGGGALGLTTGGDPNVHNGFLQTNIAARCGAASFCSGRTASQVGFQAQFKGAGAGTAQSLSVNPNAANEIILMWELPVPTPQVWWQAGNWTVRVNVTTANANITLTEVYLCRVAPDPDCTSKGSIGSLTGQNVSCATTGVKSFTVSGTEQTLAVGDRVFVLIVASNSAGTMQTVGITSDQYIDSPFQMDLVWDELVNKNGLSIPIVEFVQAADPTKLWQYLLMFNRRVRAVTTASPSAALVAVDGGAGTMTGTYQFLYTWVSNQAEKNSEAIESFASPLSAPLTLSGRQASLSGIATGPAGVTGRNVYARKSGMYAGGQYPTSECNLVAVIGNNTTTTATINTDYPFYSGPVGAGIGHPPPTKAALDWVPSISTTWYAPEKLDYVDSVSNTVSPMTLDGCRRWYFLQVALNCRAFDTLSVWNQRGFDSNNNPVVGPMSANAQISLTSVAGDTGVCELEGVLADGVSINRESITLNGLTTVLSAQTYSILKWVGAQASVVGPVNVKQGAGGANLIIPNPNTGGSPTLSLKSGHGIYKAGADGLPYGVLQLYNDTWTALGQVNSVSGAILAPGAWTRISAVTPVFQPQDEGASGVNTRGIYAAKKSVGGILYIIAINLEEVQGTSNLVPQTTGTLTTGSAIVTAIPSTSGWVAGMPVSGPGIPFASTILSVDSATQIHLSANSTRTASASPFYVALEKPLTIASNGVGGTIDVGQTINTCVRVAGETGSPSFAGSVITDDFAAMAVHVYQIT